MILFISLVFLSGAFFGMGTTMLFVAYLIDCKKQKAKREREYAIIYPEIIDKGE